jgi:hypothetical protein
MTLKRITKTLQNLDNMNTQQINDTYTKSMISSMETDYLNWTMTTCGGAGYTWLEFHSPEYRTPVGARKSYAFTLNYDGAYINGRIMWTVPAIIKVNPLNPLFWRFWIAKQKLVKFLKQKAAQEHLEHLGNHIK